MTASNQMYLKAVYALCEKYRSVRVVDIAAALSVSKASVCYALERLSEKGYVMHESYGDVQLTASGKKAAGALLASDIRIKQYLKHEGGTGVSFTRFGEMAGQTDG
ncbi:MAG: metal-dependent transcriptional regulator [Eubacteriales bacterium]|nr:metal-dependent transcriptional regulator [Eubacteriales bacterium]